MKHDLAHEEKQNEALRELAGAVASLAAHLGLRGPLKSAHDVTRLLAKDESEPDNDTPAEPSEVKE